ncbi:hypothetical protein [Nonomuraea sp. NPDC003709]|uniref:hypothetical protein n=1 Tax=Nonomuraea sp. NPDC003709 TaxID=3154450 RepID=UPI0033A9238D
MSRRKKSRIPGSAAALTLGMILFSACPAEAMAAPSPEPGLQETQSTQKRLTPRNSARQPEGCWVRSENPERVTGRTQIAAEGYNQCLSAEPKLYVNARLIRHRFWGWQRLKDDPTEVRGRASAFSSSVWNCASSGTYNYQTETEHKIWWRDGTTGSDRTSSNVIRITC